MTALVLSCALAIILGFSAHRASVCTVRAVAELMSTRRGYMLASIVKSVFWMVAVTVPFFWLMPAASANLGGWQLSAVAVLGGFAFGLGAALNGACAYSTMARLLDGDGGMLVAIFGFTLGIMGFAALAGGAWLPRPAAAPALVGMWIGWAVLPAMIALAWTIWEALRLWRTRPAGSGLAQLVLAKQYRLSSAAMMIGLTGALLFLIYGTGGYTSTFQLVIEGAVGTKPYPTTARWVLLLAVMTGMVLSTVQRGGFRLDWRPRRAWLRNLFGGVLMGLGVALAPGGNDALVLYGLPSLSPHALPTFVALVLGIAGGLWLMRLWLGVEMYVECRNDLYAAEIRRIVPRAQRTDRPSGVENEKPATNVTPERSAAPTPS